MWHSLPPLSSAELYCRLESVRWLATEMEDFRGAFTECCPRRCRLRCSTEILTADRADAKLSCQLRYSFPSKRSSGTSTLRIAMSKRHGWRPGRRSTRDRAPEFCYRAFVP